MTNYIEQLPITLILLSAIVLDSLPGYGIDYSIVANNIAKFLSVVMRKTISLEAKPLTVSIRPYYTPDTTICVLQ